MALTSSSSNTGKTSQPMMSVQRDIHSWMVALSGVSTTSQKRFDEGSCHRVTNTHGSGGTACSPLANREPISSSVVPLQLPSIISFIVS